jgi:hypothetical protein
MTGSGTDLAFREAFETVAAHVHHHYRVPVVV